MAEVLNIGGQEFKKRSPLGVWGLAIITIGIYGFVWWYKVNDEARRYLGDESIKPGMSVLALIPGFILIVPPFISAYRTGERISRMEEKAGIQQQVSPALGILAYIVYWIVGPYYQGHLNKIWERYQQAGQPQQYAGPPAPTPGQFTG